MSYVGTDWPSVEPGEVRWPTLDFTPKLASGETIQSINWGIASLPSSTYPNVDPFAWTRFSNGAFSGAVGTCRFVAVMPKTQYMIMAQVTTSLNNVYSLWAKIACIVPAI